MKNQNQIKVFVSVFLALLSIQGTAMTGAAAMVSTPDPTEQTKEAVTEVLPEEYAPADFLSISGNDAIPNIIQGTPLAINGTVKSDFSKITVLTVGVYNAAGEQVIGKTLSPNQVEYDLQNLNDALPFENLQAGTYQYRVTASNATNQNYIVINQSFVVFSDPTVQVGATEDAITIENGSKIPNITVGTSVSISGIVRSASSNITTITVGVYDSNHKMVTGKNAYPTASVFNVKKLDDFVDFSELPVGTYTYEITVTNGTHTNYTVVNQKFTVSSSSSTATDDSIKITNNATIPNIMVGKAVSIRGTVTSAKSNITKITVGVFDANNTLVTGNSASPNAKTYNVANMDAAVKFGNLKAGTYYYKVLVTNAAHKDYEAVNQKFIVSESGSSTTTDQIKMTNGVTIPNITAGKSVSIRGTVTSATSNITKLIVGIYREDGTSVTGRTVVPNAKSYDVSKIDPYVKFGGLSAGTYYYKVLVTNATHTNYAVVNQKFTVSDGSTTTTDKLSMTGGITIPNIKVGNVVSIRGTVTSASSNLKSVTVGVYDSNNKLVTGKTATPNAKTYNVRNLDAYVSFGDLKAGTYYYRVFATNATTTNFPVVEQKFTVSANGSTTASDTLSISGGTSVPNITEGTSVVVKGTVSSASSNITSVTVGVYSASGNLITGKTAKPNAKSYDLRKLDAYVNFNLLTPGSYLYRVTVSNGTKTQQLVNQAFQVKAKSGSAQSKDKLTLSGGTTIPNIKVGKAVSIRGTVKSGTSNITSLTVGVFTSSGNLVTGKTVRPNAKSYDIHQVDAYVNFNLLSPDTYYYGVVATNSSYQNQIVSYQKFTVTK